MGEDLHGPPVLTGGKELLAAENELLRQQLAQAQAALAAREPAGGSAKPNPLQFRPRPSIDLPPVETPALFDDGTLNLMAAAGEEARALDAAASKHRTEGMQQWVAAPGGVSSSTADAVDSVLAGALHAEEGAAAFVYDDIAAAVDNFRYRIVTAPLTFDGLKRGRHSPSISCILLKGSLCVFQPGGGGRV